MQPAPPYHPTPTPAQPSCGSFRPGAVTLGTVTAERVRQGHDEEESCEPL